MGSVVAAYVHHVALLLMVGALFAEFILLRQPDITPWVMTLSRVDLVYGLAALLLLVAGLMRVFWFGKGLDFYLATPFFHLKMTLFFLIVVLSIVPTAQFWRWRQAAKSDSLVVAASEHKRARIFVVTELHLLLLIPLFAVLMARGI